MKKLTITVSEDVTNGLYAKIGAGKISRFLDRLARPHVVNEALQDVYRQMAADQKRDEEAVSWSENLIGSGVE